MAILHTQGTQLEDAPEPSSLTKPFLWSFGVVFLIAMHFFQANPGGAGLSLSFNSTTWLALSFTLGLGLYATANRHTLRFSSLTLTLLLACVILTIPVFYHDSNLEDSWLRLIGLWGGWLLLLVLQQYNFTIKQKQTLLWFIIGAVLIEVILGYVQYLILQPGNILGYNTAQNRPYGIFQQPNVMASFLATGLVVAAYLLARQKQTNVQHHPIMTKALYLVPILVIPLLWVLASRTGWLGAAVASVLILPYLKTFLSKRSFYLWCLALIIGLGGGYTLASSTGGNQLITEKSNLESPRRYTFPQTLDMVIEKPWSGYGYGRFEPAYIVYTARQHQLNPSYHAGLASMDHPHNEILYWAVEGGIVPLLGLLLAALVVLRKILKAQSGTRLALSALFFPIVLHTQLEYPFYHSSIHWVIFIVFIYWIDQLTSQYQTVSFSHISKSLLSVLSLVMPIITAFFMITALHTNSVLSRFEYQRPMNPELLNKVTNPSVWKDRFDWDVYSTQLNIGLHMNKPEYIQPYIDWATSIIKRKPRPAFYSSLIVAYQGIGKMEKAEDIRKEASFLFPDQDFSKVRFISPEERASKALSSAQASSAAVTK
ncbi:PglL family O-oligosaccharyltransferase [Vibrio rumoiensis]|uniref:Ligase n=1 Tax=Vibrio rumoiensis 1S-45 TaxID=1188252 RepID=A0A1E5E568_9VIBR|nr:Wzy polymerase domain-containing protein [Vibrio rumoiensis]OEF28484.1 ligase [Vibrio rumoiensis 1S-45]